MWAARLPLFVSTRYSGLSFEAATFCYTDGVDVITWSKERCSDDVARFYFLREIAEFFDAFDGEPAEFLDVTEERFSNALLLLIVEAQLDGIVAVGLLSFALEDTVRAGEDDGDVSDDALGIVNSRLA